MPVSQRIPIHDIDPDAYRAVLGLEKYVHSGNLDEGLLALVKTRASQINHCAWCLDTHAAEARQFRLLSRRAGPGRAGHPGRSVPHCRPGAGRPRDMPRPQPQPGQVPPGLCPVSSITYVANKNKER